MLSPAYIVLGLIMLAMAALCVALAAFLVWVAWSVGGFIGLAAVAFIFWAMGAGAYMLFKM
jgi:hypothetical protein